MGDVIDEILAMKYPGELFEPDVLKIKVQYLLLARKYHPDCLDDQRADKLFAHISGLRDMALDLLNEGLWRTKDKICFLLKNSGWVFVRCDSSHAFELGTVYISDNRIAYYFEKEHLDLYENAVTNMANLRYADADMEREFRGALPRILLNGITLAGGGIIILEKDKDEYPLAIILEKLGGTMDARHVAWIISRLCNICCYLQYRGLAHNGLSISSLFINPIQHTIGLYGGWCYTVYEGEKLIGTTGDVYAVMSEHCRHSKRAEFLTDQEMVHEIAKLLLGNKSMVFKKNEKCPAPDAMASWIREGSCGNAYEEFERWNKTLDLSFGERRFIPMRIPGVC